MPPFHCWWCSPPGVTRVKGCSGAPCCGTATALRRLRAASSFGPQPAPPVLSHSSRPRCSLGRSSRANPMARAATRSAPLRLLPGPPSSAQAPGLRGVARALVLPWGVARRSPRPRSGHAPAVLLCSSNSPHRGPLLRPGGSVAAAPLRYRSGRAAAISTGLHSGRNPSGRPVRGRRVCPCASPAEAPPGAGAPLRRLPV